MKSRSSHAWESASTAIAGSSGRFMGVAWALACLALVAAACSPSAAPAAPTAAPATKPTSAPSPTTAPATAPSSAPSAAAAKPSTSPAAVASPSAAVAVASPAAQPTSGAAAGAPAKLVVGFSEIYEGEIPLWVANDAGIFQKNGLDVQLQYTASSTGIAALLGSQIQVFQGGGSETLSAVAGGGDLVLLGTLVPVYPYVFMAPASIKTIDDLKGKAVGVSSPGSTSDIATRVGLKAAGINPDTDVHIVAVGSSQNRTAALMNGSIFGGLDQPPSSFELQKNGFHVLFDMASQKLPVVNNGIVVQRSWMNADHDVVQKYVDSIVEGIARTKKDKAFAVQVIEKYLKVDEQSASDTWDYATKGLFPDQPLASPDQLADAVSILSEKNPKVKDIDLNKVIDNSFVQSAVSRGLAG